MEIKAISVSQLAFYIKSIFEAEEMLFHISVVGEVSGLKIVRGIAYFDLKDENALVSCVCFNTGLFLEVKNGQQVVVVGTPNFYVKNGKLNFNVHKIKPIGQGELFLKFIEVKERLEKEGYFDISHKKELPKDIKRIGVISSSTGAVIEDIINVATRRNPAIDIVLYPSKVQGADAEKEIITGINFFENYNVDIVIIARGGGSMEDLWVFNSENSAKSVFESTIYIVSAIGHETDITILDFVADLRAPTPSASAELVVENVESKKQLYKNQCQKIKLLMSNLISNLKNEISNKFIRFENISTNYLNELNYQLALKSMKLEKLNPNNILKLGYAKVEKGGEVVSSKSKLNSGDIIDIIFADGKIKGEIK